MQELNIEVKWNNAAVQSVCPVTQEVHKPYIGMYPFLAGTWSPILFDAIVASDLEAAKRIRVLSQSESTAVFSDASGQYEPAPVSMTVRIHDDWVSRLASAHRGSHTPVPALDPAAAF